MNLCVCPSLCVGVTLPSPNRTEDTRNAPAHVPKRNVLLLELFPAAVSTHTCAILGGREKETDRERESVCVCVYVSERERPSKQESKKSCARERAKTTARERQRVKDGNKGVHLLFLQALGSGRFEVCVCVCVCVRVCGN